MKLLNSFKTSHILNSKIQGVMVRLMLVLAPVACILAGIGISSTLSTYLKNLEVGGSNTPAPTKQPSRRSAKQGTLQFVLTQNIR